jgi:hypothetical protein
MKTVGDALNVYDEVLYPAVIPQTIEPARHGSFSAEWSLRR